MFLTFSPLFSVQKRQEGSARNGEPACFEKRRWNESKTASALEPIQTAADTFKRDRFRM
jgi:hypothetical protein